MSDLFKLNVQDVAKGLVVSVLVVVLGALQQMVTAHGVDVASYDWATILDVAWKAGGAYLLKNVFTTSNGKVFGRI